MNDVQNFVFCHVNAKKSFYEIKLGPGYLEFTNLFNYEEREGGWGLGMLETKKEKIFR